MKRIVKSFKRNFLTAVGLSGISMVVFCFTAIGQTTKNSAAQEFRFEKNIVAYEQKSEENPPPKSCTMFVGSSTWALWGKQLEEDFQEFQAVNRGFGGSTIPEVLYATHRIILPYQPAKIVFFCGTNDVAGGASGKTTFENFKKFLARIWAESPRTEIFFVTATLAPSREKFRKEMTEYNNLIKDMASKATGLYYIDALSTIVDEDGKAKEEFFQKDRLHLNRAGQERWIPLIKEKLRETEKAPITEKSLESLAKERTELGLILPKDSP
ncbi:MAG: GDSL-type esterase/lipase family protein [Planctomycetaceae bacterium]|jgi:lysophospholipase L1-like esterase|nr:GDSL-type esterase/lipase family protein [Planctomycetaceae bacterium]